MNCFVKDHEWDEDELKGSVLVGSDTGPELWVDVSAVQDEVGCALNVGWNEYIFFAHEDEIASFQKSCDNRDAYFVCALDYIEEEYMQ